MGITGHVAQYGRLRLTRRLSGRLSRSLPWVGALLAVVAVAGAIRRKGLLGGTLREELLERGDIRERVITRGEVMRAPRFWLINSLRGWMSPMLVR